MGQVFKISVVVALLVVVSACASAPRLVGQGNLVMSPEVARNFQTYLKFPKPLVFAVSRDGTKSGWLYCNNTGPCRAPNAEAQAVSYCNTNDGGKGTCRVYAYGTKVVWNGSVRVGRPAQATQDLVGKGPLVIALWVDQKYRKYAAKEEPLAFAISLDGKRSGGTFCRKPGTCKNFDSKTFALRECNKKTITQSPCRLFAVGRKIVWQGPRTLAKAEHLNGPAMPNVQASVVPPQTSVSLPGGVASSASNLIPNGGLTSPSSPSPSSVKNAMQNQTLRTMPARLRSSKAFKDLEEEIRRAQRSRPSTPATVAPQLNPTTPATVAPQLSPTTSSPVQ